METPSHHDDLNALVPVDKTVLFGSPPVVYTIPGDMPMDIYLHVQMAILEDTDEIEGTKHLHAALFKLFTYYLPEDGSEDRKKVRADCDLQVKKLGVRTMLKLINHVYSSDEDQAPGDLPADAATPPPSGTTPTTTGAPSTSSSPTLPQSEVPEVPEVGQTS